MPIAVSQKWHNAIESQFRRQGYLQVILEVVPPGITSSESLECNQSSTLLAAHELLTSIPAPDEGIATFEKGYWYADGSRYLYDDTEFRNNTSILWSSRYPSSEEDIVFNLHFSEIVSLPGLTFRWDTINNLFPSIILIETFKAGEKQFGYHYEVTSINSAVSEHLDDIDAIRITIPSGSWPNPDWRVRMSSITPGLLVQIDPQTHMYAEESETVSRIGERLPSSTSRIDIRNIVSSIGGASLMKPVALSNEANNPYQSIQGALREKDPLKPTMPRIASIEERYWGASGSWVLFSDQLELNPDTGWASWAIYDPASFRTINATVYNDLHPLSLRFKLDGVSDLDRLLIDWDTATGSYPTLFEVICYDVYGNPILQHTFQNESWASNESQILDITAEYCAEFEIVIYRWSQKGWRARIDHIELDSSWDFGGTFSEVNDFFDPMLKRGFSKYLAQRQKVYWQWGFVVDNMNTVEWLPQQMRYLDSWELPADAITATFRCTSRLSLMTSTYRQGKIQPSKGISLYQMAVRVIMNSTIIKESFNDHPYRLAAILDTLYTTAPEPVVQENIILQYIAGAAGCILKTDPISQAIVIADDATPTYYTVGRKQQLQNPSVKITTELKELNVNVYTYSVDEPKEDGTYTLTEAFNGVIKIKGRKTVVLNFNNNVILTAPEYTIEGAQINSIEFYTGSAVVDLGIEGDDTEKEVSVLIKGRRYNSSFTTYRMYENTEITNGNIITINNPLITNLDVAEHLVKKLLPWFINRHTLGFQYLGYPELKAGDEAAIYSKYSNSVGFISEVKLTFNGGWGGSLTTELDIGKED